jgi:hypothetical protein
LIERSRMKLFAVHPAGHQERVSPGAFFDRQQQHYRQRSGPRRFSLAEGLRERAVKTRSDASKKQLRFHCRDRRRQPGCQIGGEEQRGPQKGTQHRRFPVPSVQQMFRGLAQEQQERLSVRWPAVGSCRREFGAGCAQVCVVESGTIQLTTRARNILLRQDSSYFNIPPILGKDYGVCYSTVTKEFPASLRY